MNLITKDIDGKKFSDFINDFYKNEDGNHLFVMSHNGSLILKDFHYTTTDAIDSFYMNDVERFFVIIDSDKHSIVSIVCYWENMGNQLGEEYNEISSTMSYLEIAKSYQHKGLLSVVCDKFAKNLSNKVFTSNHESDLGEIAHVNNHLQTACENNDVTFYEDEHELINAVKNGSFKNVYFM